MNTAHPPELERFVETVSVTDSDLNLAKAALLFATGEYPDIAVQCYLDRLDRYADLIRHRLTDDPSLASHILHINQFLFVEKAFSGNLHSYYDPRNSFLNEVMDRKLGIPITLSMLYIEIAQRLEVPIKGVSFPGHFLVKVSLTQGDLVIDPFAGGHLRSREELEEQLALLLEDQTHPAISFEQALSSTSKKDILLRMLRNLKAIYWQQKSWAKALNVANHLLKVEPGLPEELRDIGLLYLHMECPQTARRWLEHYLDTDPGAEDSDTVAAQLEQLAHPTFLLH